MTPAPAAAVGPATSVAEPSAAGRPRVRRGVARHRSAIALLAVVASVLMLRTLVVAPTRVSSDSMSPTLERGQVVLVDRLTWHGGGLRRGELVVFTSPDPNDPVLKRLVAKAGDRVEIRDAYLYVNGRRVPESYVDHSRVDSSYYGPVRVPAGQIFVLGDNRADSLDSVDYGPVDESAVIGRAVLAVWPPRRLS